MNFKKIFGGLKTPKVLRLEFSPIKTKFYSARKLLIIGDHMYFRKDLVEKKIAEVINVKIAKGELIKGKSAKAKGKSEKAKGESEKVKGESKKVKVKN